MPFQTGIEDQYMDPRLRGDDVAELRLSGFVPVLYNRFHEP
jgi:hypothetical protein